MNGLEFIRNHCNITRSDLADMLGVSKQLVCMWENGKKEIPEARKKELSEYFGVSEDLFGEIGEAQRQYLLGKAMFRHNVNGKEAYRYRVDDGVTSLIRIPVYFRDEEQSKPDDIQKEARDMRKELLREVEEKTQVKPSGDQYSDAMQMMSVCTKYHYITEMMQGAENYKRDAKVLYWYEMINMIYAFEQAFQIGNIEQRIQKGGDSDAVVKIDPEFIHEMSVFIRSHWEKKISEIEKYKEECRKRAPRDSEKMSREMEEFEKLSLEEQIKKMEEDIYDAEGNKVYMKVAIPQTGMVTARCSN